MKKRKLTHEQMDAQNWRYKKKTPPVDEFAQFNGPVVTVMHPTFPDAFKCSKCLFVAKTRKDLDLHWLDEH